MKKHAYGTTDEELICALRDNGWVRGAAARALGIRHETVSLRIKLLKTAGVVIPNSTAPHGRKKKPVDVAALQALVDEGVERLAAVKTDAVEALFERLPERK